MLMVPPVPASRKREVPAVETEMVGAVEVNVRAVADALIVSILATPVKAPPVVTFSPLPAVRAKVVPARAKVPVELPMVVAAVPVELIRVVPRMVVAPLMAFVPPEAPRVLMAFVPVPKVLVKETPVPTVVAPLEVRVVKAPVLAVPLPMVPGAVQVEPSS